MVWCGVTIMSPRWGWGGVVWCGVVWCGVTIMSPRWGWGGVVWCDAVIMLPKLKTVSEAKI